MKNKHKVGDIVKVEWDKDWTFKCPICGNRGVYQYSYCKKCKSVFKNVHCIEIVEIVEIGGEND